MPYKISIIAFVLLSLGCKYQDIDGTNAFKVSKITYTIEDEDLINRHLVETTNNKNIDYYAYLVREYVHYPGSGNRITIFLKDAEYGSVYELRIETFDGSLKYQDYYIANNTAPKNPGEVYVIFGGQDSYSVWDPHDPDISKPYLLRYEKLNSEYDKLTVNFECTSQPSKFNSWFYIKR